VQISVSGENTSTTTAEDRAKAARAEKMAVHAAGSSKLTGFFQAGECTGKSSALAQTTHAAQVHVQDEGGRGVNNMFSSSSATSTSPKNKAGGRSDKANGGSGTQDSQMTLPFQWSSSSGTQDGE